MAQLPDVYCWIKVIDEGSGKAQPDGVQLQPPGKLTVRYSVANDSHKAAGPLWVVGALRRNGVKVTPGGQSNVVPAQQITVQPGQVWSKEYLVSESDWADYVATMLGDVGGLVNEEDEKNNQAKRTFSFQEVPK